MDNKNDWKIALGVATTCYGVPMTHVGGGGNGGQAGGNQKAR